MPKKQIIQIVVIVAAFGAAGMVLYNGFFKSSVNPDLLNLSLKSVSATSNQGILPYGTTLDFTVLKKQNLLYNQVSMPKVDQNSETGIPEDNLIALPVPTQ